MKNDCMTIIDKLDERNGGDEMGVIASVPTLAEIVAQLDRLFDDVKNLVADSENNVMSSLEVIGEAVGNLTSLNKENAEEAKSDRKKLMDDVARIYDAVVVDKPAEVGSVVANTVVGASENGNNDIYAKIAALEGNQQKMLAMLEKIAEGSAIAASVEERLNAAVAKEASALREQLFAVSMANVSDGEKSEYDSYNSVILNEIYALQDSLDAVREASEKNDGEESERLSKELADLKSEITDALGKNSDNEEIIKELNKIKEEFKSRPSVSSHKAKPEPPKATVVQVKRQKKVTPVSASDTSIGDILAKIGNTDLVITED